MTRGGGPPRERALDEPRAHDAFPAVFAQAPVGMAIATLDGGFVQVNSALCAITGCTKAELLARGFPYVHRPGRRFPRQTPPLGNGLMAAVP
jgi:PAS domain-containing protein